MNKPIPQYHPKYKIKRDRLPAQWQAYLDADVMRVLEGNCVYTISEEHGEHWDRLGFCYAEGQYFRIACAMPKDDPRLFVVDFEPLGDGTNPDGPGEAAVRFETLHAVQVKIAGQSYSIYVPLRRKPKSLNQIKDRVQFPEHNATFNIDFEDGFTMEGSLNTREHGTDRYGYTYSAAASDRSAPKWADICVTNYDNAKQLSEWRIGTPHGLELRNGIRTAEKDAHLDRKPLCIDANISTPSMVEILLGMKTATVFTIIHSPHAHPSFCLDR